MIRKILKRFREDPIYFEKYLTTVMVILFMIAIFFMARSATNYDREMKERNEYLCNEVYEPGTQVYDMNCIPWWDYLSGRKSRARER